jgi:4-hydroxy-3-methylbut-2-enyl diphosphate reductase
MGVRRAIEMVLEDLNKGDEPIFTFGPIIHNQQVMDLLESKGVFAIDDITECRDVTVAIRAHGIPPQERKLLRSSRVRLIDATCPRVARVQSIIRYYTKKDYTGVIVGDREHAEVIGLLGYGNGRVHVLNRPSEVSDLPGAKKIFVVAQTTQDENMYQEIVEAIKERFPKALIFDTICDSTHNRQREVKSFAGQVDGLVVVGGYHSGNTRRLVQVAESAGLATFHVETEKELDKEKLSEMEVVGVTAGASTPNWMIKNVVRELEAIRGRRETLLGRWMRHALKFMLLTNLLVALGGFSLTHAAALLAGRRPDLIHPSLAFFYIYAMHVLNRFLDKGASTYNDPEMAHFYKRHRNFLIITGIASIIGALILAYLLGTPIFLAVAGISVLGIIYSIPIVPGKRRVQWRYSKIKDIPGSKTFSVAFAWAALIALIPLLESTPLKWAPAFISFLFVFSMVYVRSALFDIFQVQGDLIVGEETLPIILGERRTLLLLKGLLFSVALLLVAAPIFGLVGPFSYLLVFSYLSLTLCLFTYERRWVYPSARLEAMVDGNFFLAGLLGLMWQILT